MLHPVRASRPPARLWTTKAAVGELAAAWPRAPRPATHHRGQDPASAARDHHPLADRAARTQRPGSPRVAPTRLAGHPALRGVRAAERVDAGGCAPTPSPATARHTTVRPRRHRIRHHGSGRPWPPGTAHPHPTRSCPCSTRTETCSLSRQADPRSRRGGSQQRWLGHHRSPSDRCRRRVGQATRRRPHHGRCRTPTRY